MHMLYLPADPIAPSGLQTTVVFEELWSGNLQATINFHCQQCGQNEDHNSRKGKSQVLRNAFSTKF